MSDLTSFPWTGETSSADDGSGPSNIFGDDSTLPSGIYGPLYLAAVTANAATPGSAVVVPSSGHTTTTAHSTIHVGRNTNRKIEMYRVSAA